MSMWNREDHLAKTYPAHLENKRATREELRRHQARRDEMMALASAQEALEPKESIIERASKWLPFIGRITR